MTSVIIDHSHTSTNRSLTSEDRLKRRQESIIQETVNVAANNRNLSDFAGGGNIKIKVTMVEPTLEYDRGTGQAPYVIFGNDILNVGDVIAKPRGGRKASGGGGIAGSGEDEEDEFSFVIPTDEWMKHLLADLKLPNMRKTTLNSRDILSINRAGYSPDGAPSQRDMRRTAAHALGRRLALKRPNRKAMLALEEEIAELEKLGDNEGSLLLLRLKQDRMKMRRRVVPFIDKGDQRFRRMEIINQPISSAVIFCLMDVSGSMTEHHKDLAKRFFWLLQLFLEKEYTNIDVVFIRHTDTAQEVNEETFFNDRKTGGTVIMTPLELMNQIIDARYPLTQWNVYCCQAGDGDAGTEDSINSAAFVIQHLLPKLQYFAYLECQDEGSESHTSSLWDAYSGINRPSHFAMRRVSRRDQIFSIFQNLFRDESAGRRVAG